MHVFTILALQLAGQAVAAQQTVTVTEYVTAHVTATVAAPPPPAIVTTKASSAAAAKNVFSDLSLLLKHMPKPTTTRAVKPIDAGRYTYHAPPQPTTKKTEPPAPVTTAAPPASPAPAPAPVSYPSTSYLNDRLYCVYTAPDVLDSCYKNIG